MKNLALIIAIVTMIMGTATAKNSFDKAIKSCEKQSVKKIEKAFCNGESPKEMYNNQYNEVFELVKTGLEETLEDYLTFVKKNSKKDKNDQKVYEVNVENGEIKTVVKEYLNLYRGKNLLEIDTTHASLMYKSVTLMILEKYYVKNFLKAASNGLNSLMIQKGEHLNNFLKHSTVIPKVDEKKLINKMSEDYINDQQPDIEKLLTCIREVYYVLNLFDTTDEISVKHNSDYIYIKTLTAMAIKDPNGKKPLMTKITTGLQAEVKKDIIAHIETSTKIK